VLFSAAIPPQRGTHHVNCQWPDYWQALFERQGFIAFDSIRPALWDDDEVEFWYRQNTIVYVRRDCAERDGLLRDSAPPAQDRVARLVHPRLCDRWEPPSLREVLAMLPVAARSAVARRLGMRQTVHPAAAPPGLSSQ
jgi:hypothetical protein